MLGSNGHSFLASPDAEVRRAAILKARPEIMDGVQFVLALQKHERPPRCAGPADADRRAIALKRAKALASRLPVWPPGPPVPFKPQLDGAFDAEVWSDKRMKNHGGRKPQGERAFTPAELRARYLAKKAMQRKQAMQPEPPLALPATEFPMTVAAAMAAEKSQFAIGDALLREVGEPSGRSGPDGSYAKIDECREVLLKNGIDYSSNTLRKIRAAAFTFPPSRRRHVSFHMHTEALNPENLDAAISALPAGEKMTVDFIQDFVRSRRDPSPAKDAPKDIGVSIAALMTPLVSALTLMTKANRIEVAAKFLRLVGLVVADLDSRSCQHEAARRLAAPSLVEHVAAVA